MAEEGGLLPDGSADTSMYPLRFESTHNLGAERIADHINAT